MANISDIIEDFLKQLLSDCDNVNISRNELANYFSCSPSQINYVLTTRFTPARGFVVESRRGGGGFISLVRLDENRNEFLDTLRNLPLREGISQTKAIQIIERLCRDQIISENEAKLLVSVMSDKALVAPAVAKDGIRAGMIRAMATELLKRQEVANHRNEHREV